MSHSRRRTPILLGMLAGSLAVAMLVACVTTRQQARAHAEELALRLGKMAMKQGQRCAAVGDVDGALAHYHRALAGRFHDARDRAEVEERSGILYWKMNDYDTALRYLESVYEGPNRSLQTYQPMMESLMAQGRIEEAKAVTDAWDAVAEDEWARAKVRQARGWLALKLEDFDAAKEHFEAALTQEATLPCAIDLAQRYHEDGEAARAIELLTNYLSLVPPGNRADKAWALLDIWAPPGD